MTRVELAAGPAAARGRPCPAQAAAIALPPNMTRCRKRVEPGRAVPQRGSREARGAPTVGGPAAARSRRSHPLPTMIEAR